MIIRNKVTGQKFELLSGTKFPTQMYEIVEEPSAADKDETPELEVMREKIKVQAEEEAKKATEAVSKPKTTRKKTTRKRKTTKKSN